MTRAAPDYIVVGSGINGLTCAALLGKKGRRVLVLEREKVAGGCMRTEAITAPGYIHDVMATTFVLFITSPAFAQARRRTSRSTAWSSATREPDRRASCRTAAA